MVLPSLFVGLLLLAGLPQPVDTAPAPGNLRWVRGHVTSAGPAAIALTLKDKAFLATITPATEVMRFQGAPIAITTVAPGSLVDVHFTEKNGERRVVLVVADVPSTGVKLSNRTGRSYRGIVRHAKRGELSLRVDQRNRGVKLDKKTTLADAGGRALATGSKDISGRLTAGDVVLVTYDERSDDIYAGDMLIAGSAQHALDIRVLRAASQN